jgi:hypothetical protein
MKGIRISEDSEIKLTSKGDLINFFSGNWLWEKYYYTEINETLLGWPPKYELRVG